MSSGLSSSRRRRPASSAWLVSQSVRTIQRSEFAGTYLPPAFISQFDSMIWNHLMDSAVLVALGLGMPDEDDEARFAHLGLRDRGVSSGGVVSKGKYSRTDKSSWEVGARKSISEIGKWAAASHASLRLSYKDYTCKSQTHTRHSQAIPRHIKIITMSDPGPDSIPTSSHHRSGRPTKKRALTPVSQQQSQVEALFANPDREIALPSGAKARFAAAPPEIVANVQGSSAGAGSGEFHVYKASRRRENERLRLMDEDNEREKADADFKTRQEELKRLDEEKLKKSRAKREKAKARSGKKKQGGGGEETAMAVDGDDDGKLSGGGAGVVKKRLGASKLNVSQSNGHDEVENSKDRDAPEEVGITIHEDN